MITVWYASDSIDAPEPVECEQPGYPRRDVQGRTMYENSHFGTEAEAWKYLQRSGRVGQELSSRAYAHAQETLAKATAQLAEDAARRTRIETGYEEFQRRQEKP